MSKYSICIYDGYASRNGLTITHNNKNEVLIEAFADDLYISLLEVGNTGTSKFWDVPLRVYCADALLGIYEINDAYISESIDAGFSIKNEKIYVISDIEIIPLFSSNTYYRCFKDIISLYQSNCFFYSYTYDLSQSMQRQYERNSNNITAPYIYHWNTVDKAFVWNYNICAKYFTVYDERATQYFVPVINGFIQQYPNVNIDGELCDITLISRRSQYHAGVRYLTRGLNDQKNPANFVETEQIVVRSDGVTNSFVMIRGSIPLYWKQDIYIKYTPRILLCKDELANKDGLNYHMNSIFDRYNAISIICLINKKKDELLLGQAYERAIQPLLNQFPDKINFTWFDFHRECRNMKWENLKFLMNELEHNIEEYKYFSIDNNNRVLERQKGTFRVNCIDNLDRTNVVESMIGRRSILIQLKKTYNKDVVLDSPYSEFEKSFKCLWANNADALSLIYSGTGALKVDFTKTGKRTFSGLLRDGKRSLKRFVQNNFNDGAKQDAIILATGQITEPFHPVKLNWFNKHPYKYSFIFLIIFIIVFEVLLVAFSKSTFAIQISFYSILFLILVLYYIFVKVGVKCGKQFTDQSSLLHYKKRSYEWLGAAQR